VTGATVPSIILCTLAAARPATAPSRSLRSSSLIFLTTGSFLQQLL
jgi:hypothetical protein